MPVNQTGVTIQDFLQIYQSANAQFDTFLTLMGIFITVFSAITAIVVAFFAIKQINVDKEIIKYRDEIKLQKELAIQEVKNIKTELENIQKWTNETKIKIDNELKKPPNKQTKKELQEIKNNIENLKQEIAFKRGMLSTSNINNHHEFDNSLYSSAYLNLRNDSLHKETKPFPQYCLNCGNLLPSKINIVSTKLEASELQYCPSCGTVY